MTSNHNPQHGARNLASRTVASVVATIALVIGVLLSVTAVPAGIVRSFDGPVPDMPLVEVMPAEPDRVLVCMGPGLSFGSASSEPVAYGSPSEALAGANPTTSALSSTTVLDGLSLEGALSTTYPVVVSQAGQRAPLLLLATRAWQT